MSPQDAAQALVDIFQAGGSPTPQEMRALGSVHLDTLPDAQLADLGRFLAVMMKPASGQTLAGGVTAQTIASTAADPFAIESLLGLARSRQQVVSDAVRAAGRGEDLPLTVRHAFGAITSLHADVLSHAIRNGHVTHDDLTDVADLAGRADDGAHVTARLYSWRSPPEAVTLGVDAKQDIIGASQQAGSELCFDAPVEVAAAQGRFTLMVSNERELWRAATFHTKEPETVAWLDETFGEGDCLYDVGANIGLYALYALAKTRKADVVCFEPDPVNYYRLSRNIVANRFAQRAIVCPIALSDAAGFCAFNSSLFVAGKAENWISPAADLLGGTPRGKAARQPPVLRTGCAAFPLDGFLEQAAGLPRPTHLKIDVDSVEVAILRGAKDTLRGPVLRHLLVELHERDLRDVAGALSVAGFQHVRSARHNVVPRRDGFFGNHIFARA
jgi:FkbM family methyltransferase